MSAKGRHGPLHGVRILELTTVVMGRAATQILGDLGADVIKIKSLDGDSIRWIGPFYNEGAGMGPLFLQANRNKRSVVLDLKTKEGRGALLAIAADVDVLVSNIRPQGLLRLRLTSARIDSQGKSYGQRSLEMLIPVSQSWGLV